MTADGRPPEDEPVLLWELLRTAHLAERHLRAIFRREGLTGTQFGVLACLADGDDFTKAQLARVLQVRPQSMDPLIESLLASGLVRRDGEPRRGRAAGISITAAGRDRVARCRPAVYATNDPALTGIAAGDLGWLVDRLRTLRSRLERDG